MIMARLILVLVIFHADCVVTGIKMGLIFCLVTIGTSTTTTTTSTYDSHTVGASQLCVPIVAIAAYYS